MPRGRQAAEYLKGAEWFEGREGGLYKGGVLIIQKAHHKTSILEVCDAPSDVCWRPQADLNRC
ncbi:hypothetical protein Bwad001_24950 [Bilophila wadsworthia]